MKIQAYRRPDGRVGIRNHLLIIPASVCASETASRISAQAPGSVALPHQHGCCQVGKDLLQTIDTLAGLGRNPNVGAVLVVGLGCEGVQAAKLAEKIRPSGKPVEYIIIQENRGTLNTIAEGAKLARRLTEQLSRMTKSECAMADLIMGIECGASDTTSGLASNPAVGVASDLLIAAGGASILSETTEFIGAEHILAARAVTPEVGRAVLRIVHNCEARAVAMGEDLRGSQPTPGNIAGGITSIEEKSLGCIHKAGSAAVQSVVDYGVAPVGKGLHVMDTPGEDVDSMAGMLAGGVQIIVFTTGRGTPTGSPIAPVIKVTGNPKTYENMIDNIDINAGRIITGEAGMQAVGREIFEEMIAVANGKQTKSECLGHREFGIYRIGYTF